MKLIKSQIGKHVFVAGLNTFIKVTEENASILERHGKYHLFDRGEIVEKSDLLTTLKAQAETNFDGRKARDVKSDFDILGIKYPAKYGLKGLAKIIGEL